jgi:hypothetical protein
MKTLTCILGLTSLASLAAFPANAADSMRCFKVTDPSPQSRFAATVTDERGTQTCHVRLPAKFACVPSTAALTPPLASGNQRAVADNDTVLCYTVKCARPLAQRAEAGDVFGTRDLTLRAPQTMCWPASMAPGMPVTTSTTLPGTGTDTCDFSNGECRGTCPGGQRCGATVSGASCECRSVSCGDADAPQCEGACSNPGDACVFSVTGCSCTSIP